MLCVVRVCRVVESENLRTEFDQERLEQSRESY